MIVGRNGSGKSNFFDAIQFVLLAPRFANLRQEERQHLLHEGAGQNVMSAFVELIFDNSDGRLAVDGDEVVLRRTVGLKKDEFFLNMRRVNKSEVSSLLESAGFSKSNPYYIVQQGKVNSLVLMRDAERLSLLKEVAGTSVYDTRREESLRIIAETKAKRAKIQEMVEYIEERLAELDEEKEELRAYEHLDRVRRALEYTLYENDLKDLRAQLQSVEAQLSDDADDADESYEALDALSKRIRALEAALPPAAPQADAERRARAAEQEESLQERARLQVEVSELEERLAADLARESEQRAEMTSLAAERTALEQRLREDLDPAHAAAKAAAQRGARDLAQWETAADALYKKQGRSAQFSTAEERDAALSAEIAALEASLGEKEAAGAALGRRLEELRADARAAAEGASALDAAAQRRAEEAASLSERAAGAKKELKARAEVRKENWRSLEGVEEELKEARRALEQSERELSAAMPRHAADGLLAVERICREEGVSGCFGPIVDNITLTNDTFRAAVEAAAGAQLFHVVVDTDDTAALLMERLQREGAGRVTFLPLNRLRPKAVAYPSDRRVRSLLEVAIEAAPRVEKAVREVFGRKLLAQNMEAAAELSRAADMDAVTITGDHVSRRGVLHGGSQDRRESAIGAFKRARDLRETLRGLEDRQAEAQRLTPELEHGVTAAMKDLQALEAAAAAARARLSDAREEAREARRGAAALEAQALRKEEQARGALAEKASLEQQAEALRGELGTALTDRLSEEEVAALRDLEARAAAARAEAPALEGALRVCAREREEVRARLEQFVARRLEELAEALEGDQGAARRREDLGRRREELEGAERRYAAALAALDALEERRREEEAAREGALAQLEELRLEEAELGEAWEAVQSRSQQLHARRRTLAKGVEESLRRIQDVGTAPAQELAKVAGLSRKQLFARLAKAQKQLKAFGHVNRKALDQYVSFSEQRTALGARKAQLDEGEAKIEELIGALDQQKDEAILRTFKGVSGHFADVFRQLVPHGRGRLVMRTSADDAEDAEDGAPDGMPPAGVAVAAFTGVEVRVSFAENGETFLMQQLSGGQKALVALTLIFAIQRCDPAPFYLFDEIDQALDAKHRAAVSALIEDQSHAETNPAQFITTTFRPEMVEVADQCYGIGHQNKVSNIHVLTRDETLGFVASLAQEEGVEDGAVGAKRAREGDIDEDVDDADGGVGDENAAPEIAEEIAGDVAVGGKRKARA